MGVKEEKGWGRGEGDGYRAKKGEIQVDERESR